MFKEFRTRCLCRRLVRDAISAVQDKPRIKEKKHTVEEDEKWEGNREE